MHPTHLNRASVAAAAIAVICLAVGAYLLTAPSFVVYAGTDMEPLVPIPSMTYRVGLVLLPVGTALLGGVLGYRHGLRRR